MQCPVFGGVVLGRTDMLANCGAVKLGAVDAIAVSLGRVEVRKKARRGDPTGRRDSVLPKASLT
jgi:hypothetical protein